MPLIGDHSILLSIPVLLSRISLPSSTRNNADKNTLVIVSSARRRHAGELFLEAPSVSRNWRVGHTSYTNYESDIRQNYNISASWRHSAACLLLHAWEMIQIGILRPIALAATVALLCTRQNVFMPLSFELRAGSCSQSLQNIAKEYRLNVSSLNFVVEFNWIYLQFLFTK